jgi:hypothetical protein
MKHRQGYILSTSISLMVLLGLLSSAYFLTSRAEIRTNRALNVSATGTLAAEAGLNVRAPQITDILRDQIDARGQPPSETGPNAPCTGSNLGSGDFACITYTFNDRTVHTYMVRESFGRLGLRVPSDQPFGGLYTFENRYVVKARALNADGTVEAVVGARLKIRELPIFQFNTYYNGDLEYSPGGTFEVRGPVHTNGRLYINAGSRDLRFWGQVSSAQGIYRGQKALNGYADQIPSQGTSIQCNGGLIHSGRTLVELPATHTPPDCYPTAPIPEATLQTTYNARVTGQARTVETPQWELLDPRPGSDGWDNADLRVVMDVRGNSENARPEVRRRDGLVDSALTNALQDCNLEMPTVTWTRPRVGGFYDGRERKYMATMEVNVRNLLTCMHTRMRGVGGVALDDGTNGGLVWHFSIDASDANAMNNPYAVRLQNAQWLWTNGSANDAPAIRGLTVVTNQKAYVWGDYNITNKRPAAIMADTVTILSGAWSDARSAMTVANRVPIDSRYNFASIAGIPESRVLNNNGHVQNYLRMLEDWRGRRVTYRGSLVSLGAPRTTNSPFMYWDPGGDPARWNTLAYYAVPSRDFALDPDFSTPAGLPPMTPSVKYPRVEDLERTYAR